MKHGQQQGGCREEWWNCFCEIHRNSHSHLSDEPARSPFFFSWNRVFSLRFDLAHKTNTWSSEFVLAVVVKKKTHLLGSTNSDPSLYIGAVGIKSGCLSLAQIAAAPAPQPQRSISMLLKTYRHTVNSVRPNRRAKYNFGEACHITNCMQRSENPRLLSGLWRLAQLLAG